MCADGSIVCVVTFLFDAFSIWSQAYQSALTWFHWAWAEIQPHLTWISTLTAIAMGAWRWWGAREEVIWRRVMKILADQEKYVQDALTHSLATIVYPSPTTPPQLPIFAVKSLRRIFARHSRQWWHPLHKVAPITWAIHSLKSTHAELDAKDNTISRDKSFAIAQRYSAFVLQGALAAARANEKGRNRLNQVALGRFNRALALEGKGSDAVILELKCLQLRKLGRIHEAAHEFNRLQVLLEGRLQAVTPLSQTERHALLVQLLRVIRYQSEIDHQINPNGAAANNRLLGLMQNPTSNSVFTDHLEFQDLLERAHYHEVHACARVRLTGTWDAVGAVTVPNNGVAQQSLTAARTDYEALSDQVTSDRFSWPVRLWRWLKRADKKDGTFRLRVAAREGLQSLEGIAAGKGCQFCRTQDEGPGPSDAPTNPTNSE